MPERHLGTPGAEIDPTGRAAVPRFGTDGIRGVANSELSVELVLALGKATARVMGKSQRDMERRPRFLIGRDTRCSGTLLQAALSAGLASEGVDVVDVGVLPTPAVAFLSQEQNFPAAVISASHNPYWDNGIKLFAVGGIKLPGEIERAIEAELGTLLAAPRSDAAQKGQVDLTSIPARIIAKSPTGAEVGHITADTNALKRYEHHVLQCLEGRRLSGLQVVLDCAHGAAFASAPDIFRAAGAEVVAVLGAEPDGTNINEGYGSTDPRQVAAVVASTAADIGLAFDGDADRMIAVDANGNVVDGDRLLALFATDFAGRHLLTDSTVVVTVMTNLGFHYAMRNAGIGVHTVAVGDRYVLEALDAHGWALGGEQSGHIIFRPFATTGDGVLSGLLLADLVCQRGVPLSELAAAALQRLPQVLRNVRVTDRDSLAGATKVWETVRQVEQQLGQRGRVLLRPSGTEPLVRIMAEAPTEQEAEQVVALLANTLGAELGIPAPIQL